MKIRHLPPRLWSATIPWLLLMLLGVLGGMLFYNRFYAWLMPLIQSTAGLAQPPASIASISLPVYLLLLYIFKNSLVALLCMITARPSRGLFPGLVMIINGMVLGFAAVLFHNRMNLAYSYFLLAILPHGIFEFTAVFIACALGMQAVDLRGKFRLMWLPLSFILVAAIIETFVSPLVIQHLI